MSIVPMLKATEVLRVLLKAGFRVMRQTGSHIRLQHWRDVTRQVTIPFHKNVDIPRWLLSSILRQAKISIKEFLKLLRT